MKRQPAEINYFFKQGYIEFFAVIIGIFKGCGYTIAKSWRGVCEHFVDFIGCVSEIFDEFFPALGNLFMLIFHLCIVLLSIFLAIPVSILIAAVQAVLLLVLMVLFYAAFLIVLFADWVYRRIKRISTSCPNCQEKFALPTYQCVCGAEHTKLVPSRYGIFSRVCSGNGSSCRRKLKTTFFNGRQKLPGEWICPHCNYVLGSPLQSDLPIPVVGGPSSGKTCYISMVISQLEKKASSDYNLSFEYKENAALGDDYADNREQMSRGRLPLKTNDMRLRYYQFYLAKNGAKVRNLVSLCDVAGETYEHSEEMGRQIGFKYADAFLMLVDPLSVMAYREEVAQKVDISKYGASEKSMDEVLDGLIHTLESMKCIDSKSSIKTDVAVVFTKCDIPGLDDKIGAAAVNRYRTQNSGVSKYDAQNKVCEQFLTEYEEENFLNTLRSKFKSIQFFTCSALGHVENGKQFAPTNVEEPTLWLIDKVNSSLSLKKKFSE